MRIQYAVALAMLAGVGLGAVATERLHAQAKPPVYVVTEIAVRNVSGYVNEYVPVAQASIRKAGGKILAASLNVTQLEGPAPTRVVIQVWDSPEQIAAWRHGADYDDIRKIGERVCDFSLLCRRGLAAAVIPTMAAEITAMLSNDASRRAVVMSNVRPIGRRLPMHARSGNAYLLDVAAMEGWPSGLRHRS